MGESAPVRQQPGSLLAAAMLAAWPAAGSRAPWLPAGTGTRHARLDLPPDPARVADARALTQKLLASLGWEDERADDAVLVTSELAANAVVQATPARAGELAIIVTLVGSPAGLTILTWDNGPCDGLPDDPAAPAAPAAPADDAESGRGLAITAALTGGQWGWWPTPCSGGKVLWAFLAAAP